MKAMIDKAAASAYMAQIERNLASMPLEVLQEAKRRQEIEAHNAEVDAKKARKKQMKRLFRRG